MVCIASQESLLAKEGLYLLSSLGSKDEMDSKKSKEREPLKESIGSTADFICFSDGRTAEMDENRQIKKNGR
jgi:hypothetical protein